MTKPIIPEAALKQHVAELGTTGSGKSYTARGIVEGLLDERRRVCILDYTGVWYGLRSTASGKRAAYPVIIFGGEHADVPLNEHAGPSLAKVVATGNRPCIIDVDGMTVGAQQRFVTAFLEELYRLNSKPLHLVIEEIDEFAPQTGAPGAERMIGAVCRIFQRGRRKGFRAIAITQRPANVHKRVLTQCSTLIAQRLNAPQDRAAVLDWIRGHADLETGKRIVDDLPKLQTGEGYVWAPQQRVLEKVRFPAIRTFDSMRAPEDGEDLNPANWADVDLEGIKGEMAEAVKEAEANDPKKLRAELAAEKAKVAALEREAAKKPAQPGPDPQALADAEARGYNQAREDCLNWMAGILTDVQIKAEPAIKAVVALGETLQSLKDRGRTSYGLTAPPARQRDPSDFERVNYAAQRKPPARAPSAHTKPQNSPRAHGEGTGTALQRAERAVLTAAAQRHPKPSTRAQLAILSGYSLTSSSFANACGALRSAGYLDGRGDANHPTAAGLQALSAFEPIPTGRDLVEWWASRLDKAEREFLRFIAGKYPYAVTRAAISEATGYSTTSSSFANALGKLRTLELVQGRGDDIKATDDLFG